MSQEHSQLKKKNHKTHVTYELQTPFLGLNSSGMETYE